MDKFNHLAKKQLAELKRKLEEEIMRINEAHKVKDESLIISKEEQRDEVDMASVDYANSHRLRMRNREILYTKKLNRALKKFDTKDYGLCEDCGAEIKFQRLIARPTAELCILCKEESEQDEVRNLPIKVSKSYSKAVDIQKIV